MLKDRFLVRIDVAYTLCCRSLTTRGWLRRGIISYKVKPGFQQRRKHKHKHKSFMSRENERDASTSIGKENFDPCAYACVDTVFTVK